MSCTPPVDAAIIQQWLAKKMNTEELRANLYSLGWQEDAIAAHLKEFKKARCVKRQFAGFIYLAAGAFIGFVSCVLTLTNPIPDLYNYILFGLTSVAMGLIFLGLYHLFE